MLDGWMEGRTEGQKDGRTDGSIDLIGMKDGLRLASIILPFITNNFNTRSNYY